MIFVDVGLVILALPALAAAGYLGLLALLSRPPRPPPPAPRRLRFDVVVPAHDEESGIAATVRSLAALDWPQQLFRVIVVADNCTDSTAARAREAGAAVLVRNDPARRGKGHALEHAFRELLADAWADAVVVVDADTVVSRNLLCAFAARLEAGAEAVQSHYGVRNAGDSWRTRLMAIAFTLFHGVRSIGRERLGLSAGLRGNGMCFSVRLLREIPYDAFSKVEDLEYGLRLGEAGRRVHYALEANVQGEMPVSSRAARAQRHRWEGGRAAMRRAHAARLLRRGLAGPSRVALDLAADLFVPPLTRLAVGIGGGFVAASAASFAAGRPLAALWAWGLAAAWLAAYVLRGWQLSGTGARGLVDVATAPAYVLWKLSLVLDRRARAAKEWERTPRDGRQEHDGRGSTNGAPRAPDGGDAGRAGPKAALVRDAAP